MNDVSIDSYAFRVSEMSLSFVKSNYEVGTQDGARKPEVLSVWRVMVLFE